MLPGASELPAKACSRLPKPRKPHSATGSEVPTALQVLLYLRHMLDGLAHCTIPAVKERTLSTKSLLLEDLCPRRPADIQPAQAAIRLPALKYVLCDYSALLVLPQLRSMDIVFAAHAAAAVAQPLLQFCTIGVCAAVKEGFPCILKCLQRRTLWPLRCSWLSSCEKPL